MVIPQDKLRQQRTPYPQDPVDAPALRRQNGAMIDDPVLKNDWQVVGRAADLDEGSVMAASLFGTDLVLWRSGGEVMAWKDHCAHRGTRLSLGTVKDGQLTCPYHAWHYNKEGRCTFIPAMPKLKPPEGARVEAYRAKEAYGFLWVSMGEPERDVPPFPEWTDDAYRKQIVGPYNFHANPFRTVENFIDIPHFPFVHPMINGDPSRPDLVEDYEVFEDEQGIGTGRVPIWQPFADHRGVPAMTHYSYRCFRPTTAYFAKETGDDNMFCMMLTVTPLATDDCLVWLLVAINFGDQVTEQQIVDRQDKVFSQDKWIVESQRPAEIPLDLKDELHIRADKFSVAYRRWLKGMGLKWGVAESARVN